MHFWKEENEELKLRFSTEDLKSHIKKYFLKSQDLKTGQTSPADVQLDIGQVRPENINNGPDLHNTINIGQYVSVPNSENASINESSLQKQRVRNYQQLPDNDYNPKAEAQCFSPCVEETSASSVGLHNWDSYYFPPDQYDTYIEEY